MWCSGKYSEFNSLFGRFVWSFWRFLVVVWPNRPRIRLQEAQKPISASVERVLGWAPVRLGFFYNFRQNWRPEPRHLRKKREGPPPFFACIAVLGAGFWLKPGICIVTENLDFLLPDRTVVQKRATKGGGRREAPPPFVPRFDCQQFWLQAKNPNTTNLPVCQEAAERAVTEDNRNYHAVDAQS